MNTAQDVLNFWFDPANQPFWFQKSHVFDQQLRDNFAELLIAASHAELWSWRKTAEGRLAEIIVLD